MKQFLLFICFICCVSFSDAQDSTVYYHGDWFPKSKIPMNIDSVEDISKLISIYPDSANLFYKRGYYFLASYKPNAAKEDFKMAVEMDSANYEALGMLAWMYYQENNDSLMEQYYKRYLYFQPTDTEAMFILGRSLFFSGKKQEAISYIKRTVNDSFIAAEAFLLIGLQYEELRDGKNSKENYVSALEKIEERMLNDSLNGRLYFLRAFLHTRLNNYRTVLEDYDKSIFLEPDRSYKYFFRGIARKEMGRKDASCGDFLTAAKMGYGEYALYELCADCKELCKQYCIENEIENPLSKKKKQE